MLNIRSHKAAEIVSPAWGVHICPACKGMGVLSKQEHEMSAYRIADYYCPLCALYKDVVGCKAWDHTFVDGKVIWEFYPEDCCDDIRRILKSIDSIRTKNHNSI